MDISPLNTAEVNSSISKVRFDNLKRIAKARTANKAKSIGDKAQLAKAARGFESMFVHIMIKEMKSAMLEEKKEDNNFGADILSGYADMLLADDIANTGNGVGIAGKIYSQLTGGEKLKPITVIKSLAPTVGNVQSYIASSNVNGGSFMSRLISRLSNYEDYITGASDRFNVPANLIKAIITAESAGKFNAVSRAGAKGLMQLMDTTAAGLGVDNSFDPEQNIYGGTSYISKMMDQFDGKLELALAAYNAGPGNVIKYSGIPPFPETRSYISRVKKYQDIFMNLENM